MALFVLNRVRISDPQWHPYTKHGHVPPSLPLDRRVGGGRREGRVWEVRAREWYIICAHSFGSKAAFLAALPWEASAKGTSDFKLCAREWSRRLHRLSGKVLPPPPSKKDKNSGPFTNFIFVSINVMISLLTCFEQSVVLLLNFQRSSCHIIAIKKSWLPEYCFHNWLCSRRCPWKDDQIWKQRKWG